LALQRLTSAENLENPAIALYQEWNNEFVHKYANVVLPEEYKIDLRNFAMPTESRRVTSSYGWRRSFGRMHKGIDVKVYIGDTIRAAFNGKVRVVAYERGGYGKYIVMRHPNGLETVYAHMSKHLVAENQIVKAGDPIGLGGNTGKSTASHLHFETRFLGQSINPAFLFDFEKQDVTSDYYMFRSGKKTVDSSSASKSIASSKVKVHRVRAGESLSKIAIMRGTTVNELCRLNGISKKAVLRPGQILKYS
jgi:murein DD-endopeptidase MepM/ murein hydrolase activator NlpD